MKPPTRRKIFDVVGEAATNEDGTKRQDILREVTPGDKVRLVREPTNRFDPNAIGVWLDEGQVGYLNRDDAAELAGHLDIGREYESILHCIRGGVPGARHYGCRISIAWDGAKSHPFQPLDDEQIRSRAGKRAIAGRSRDDRGKLVANEKGCFGVAACFGLVGLALYLV